MGANGRLKKQIQKKADEGAPPQDMALGQKMADPSQKGKVDPKKIKQVEDITAMFMNLIHSEDSRDSVMQLLKSNPEPSKAISATANTLMTRVEQQAKQRRQRLPDDAKVAAAQYMVPDLAMLGNKSRAWGDKQVTSEQLGGILKDTMQIYIRQGIKNKSLDPVKLQRDVEQLMTPEQRKIGMEYGGGELPPGPTPAMAVGQHVSDAVTKEQAKTEQARAQAEALKGNMRQSAASRNDAQQMEQNAALTGPA